MATTTILWTGREYYSLENCQVETMSRGSEIRSTIVGQYGKILYTVEYLIQTDARWHTRFVDVKARINGRALHLQFEGDGHGHWKDQGKTVAAFEGCTDVDIPLTPFTNTLPINRLNLSIGEEKQIQVLYIDLLDDRITPVRQQYRRLATGAYHYENVPNDFEADIQVDEAGLVVDYPALFVRTHARKD
jgi:uncharacterized protein